MELVLHFLKSIKPMSPGLIKHLQAIVKPKQLQKREYLLRAGQVCRNIYFIEQGLLRCYYNKYEHEVCSWFMKEGDVIISVESFYNQTPSYESIQALEDSRLFYIGYNELQAIYRDFPEFNFIGRKLTEKYYCLSEQRLYSIRMQRTQERYDYLLEHNPELLLRVSARHLSSYLNMTEVTLSKLKTRL